MQIRLTEIADVYVLKPRKIRDERGYFVNMIDAEDFAVRSMNLSWNRYNVVKNNDAYTFRGFHMQLPPRQEYKLISCSRGSIIDFALDLRKSSQTYLMLTYDTLSPLDMNMLYVPPGVAHAYYTLEENTFVHYLVSNEYSPKSEIGVRWNDPMIEPSVESLLPYDIEKISVKDQSWPDIDI